MGNVEWEMWKWEMGNGKWEMENGKRKMGKGKWEMESLSFELLSPNSLSLL